MSASAPQPAGIVHNPWVVNVLRPALLTLMAGCVALPVAQVIHAVAPAVHFEFLLSACVFTALEVNYTHRLIRAHYTSGMDLLRVRAIEAGFIFIILKAVSLALNGLPAGAPLDWLLDYHWWLDPETLIALVLAVGVAFGVDAALDDFDRIGEAAEPGKDYISSVDSLTRRFFMTGAFLLVFSGLARINLVDILRLDRPPVTGLVGNVLLYFLLGLLLISQVRLELLAINWQTQGVRTPPDLTQRWVRYTLAFIGLAGLLAFALPTGFTLGGLGLLGDIIGGIFLVLWTIIFFIVTLLLLPFRWLDSLIHSAPIIVPLITPAPPTPVPTPAPNIIPNQPPAWLDTVTTIFVVIVIVLFITYIIWRYLHDRPDLMEAIKNLAPLRAMRRMWALLRHRVSGALATAREATPLAWLRERWRRVAPGDPLAFFRLSAAAPREQVLFYYLSLLRRAGQQGFGRQPPQSPREYEPVLEQNLPEAKPDLQELTHAFEETRYSDHPVSAAQAQAARARWQQIRAALTRKRKDG